MQGQRWKGIMKCYPFEEKRLAKWQPPYIVQPKFDGDRCVNEPLHEDLESSLLLTSEENVFYSVPHINDQLSKSGLYKIPLDGELYSHKLFLEGGHELIHSIASRTVNLHSRYQEMEYWVFDYKHPQLSQMERISTLNQITFNQPNIKLAPYWICDSLDHIKKIYDHVVVDLQYEGIIIRHIHAPYVEKRSIYVMKFKPKQHDTYTIVGYNEEVSINNVPKGRIGSLILSSGDGNIFAVSAGLNDEDRDILWQERESLAGKSAIVHYQHLTNKQIPKGCFDIEVEL